MAKVIGIISGKGGVGKTTTAINLGLALQELGESVIIVDGDTKNPNLGLYLGLYKFPNTLQNVIRGRSIKETQYMHPSGLKIVPSSLAVSDSTIGFSKLRTVFDELGGYVILDFSPGLSKDVLSMLEICDQVLLVTNPTIPSITSTMRFINIIKDMNKELLGIIVNRSGKSYDIKLDYIEMICDAPVICEVPEDENVRKSTTAKMPVLSYKPYSRAAISFRGLAASVLNVVYEPPSFSWLRSMFARSNIHA